MKLVQPKWNFYKRVPGPSIDGNIARLFNTGDSTPPSVFARLIDADAETATSAVIYGREGIANCVDASIAAQQGEGVLGLDFYFEEFNGAEALNYWNLLDLGTLAHRAASPEIDRVKTLGLSRNDCLTAGPDAPLRILTVVERAGGGMPGSLSDPDSVLLRALMNVGEAQIRTGAAGSYGYGKAAVAQASRPRIMIVYTCSRPDANPDGVTRRLLGITYWGGHKLNGSKYTGWGILGLNENDSIVALEDDEADAFAESLDLPNRSPLNEEDLGTTFMLIDPMFGADELQGAAEIFWWPLLQGTRKVNLDLKIHDEDGETRTINVDESHAELGQFVSRFKKAETARSTHVGAQGVDDIVLVGRAGITSLEATHAGSPADSSLIALMRSPLMVVTYQPIRATNRSLTGVFVAHDNTNENLRRVEPAEHDKWLKRRVAGLSASSEDIQISKLVTSEIANAVSSLRAADPEPVTTLSGFSSLFPAVEGNVAKPKPPRPKNERKQRLVHVNLVHPDNMTFVQVDRPQREILANRSLRARAVVHFWLDGARAAKVKKKFLDATLSIGARVDEDGTAGEWLESSVQQLVQGTESQFVETTPNGRLPATFEGRFLVGEDIFFEIVTEPYDPDWTVNLIFDCSPWDVAEPKKTTNPEED